jgi:hypothetical protein
MNDLTMNRYIIAIRAGALLRLNHGESLQITAYSEWGEVRLTFQTRFSDEGFESAVPRELWIDARGPAPSINHAVESFTNLAIFFTNIVSFCANGYSGPCEFHIGYEDTKEKNEIEFLQQFIAEGHDAPTISRKINPVAVTSIVDLLSGNEHNERIHRAMSQYELALRYWSRGNEILATAHLYMGMEALVPVVRKIELSKSDYDTTEELAELWGVQIQELDGTLRREILFNGDSETHRNAKKASDGMEHGFLSYADIRPLAESVRDKTASYLRRTIVKLLQLPPQIELELLKSPYDEPFGTIGYVRIFRGLLLSEHDKLNAPGRMYPEIDWNFKINSFDIADNAGFRVSFSESISPRLGEGVSLRPISREIYGPEGDVAEYHPQEGTTEPTIVKRDPFQQQRTAIASVIDRISVKVLQYGPKEFFKVTFPEAQILKLFSRSRSLFQSASILLKRSLHQEALLISHYLYLNTVTLSKVAEADQDRAAMVFGRYLKDVEAKLAFFTKAAKVDLEINLKRAEGLMQKHKEEIIRIAIELGVEEFQDLEISHRDLRSHASAQCYFAYLLSHQIVIGTDFAYSERIREEKSDRLWVDTYSQGISTLGIAAGFACESALLATRATGKILGWDEIDSFSELMAEAHALFDLVEGTHDQSQNFPDR